MLKDKATQQPSNALLEEEFENHPKPGRREARAARTRTRRSLQQSLIELGESARDGHLVNILLLLGLPLLGFGIWLSFFKAPADARETKRVQRAPVLEMGDFRNVEPGEDVVLAGTLGVTSGPKPISQIADRAARQGMVVYVPQRWDCDRDDDGHYDGSWEGSERVAPEVITIDDREVSIALAKTARMNGERFYSPVILEGDGRLCDGRREGSIRVVGYRTGDQIIAFGRKGRDGRLLVERLYGGNRDLFISHLERATRSSRRWGLILLGAGLLSKIVWLGIFLSPRFLERPREHAAYLKRRAEAERLYAVDMLMHGLARPLSGFMLLLTVVGIIVVIAIGIELVEARDSQQWTSVRGEIASTDFRRRMTVGGSRYCLDVSYQYAVNDQRYTSTRIKPHSLCYKTTIDAEIAQLAYPEGGAVTVYYDPKNPEQALLDRTIEYRAFYFGWAVLGIAGMFFGLVWLIRRSAAKALGQAPPWREMIFWLKIIPGPRS